MKVSTRMLPPILFVKFHQDDGTRICFERCGGIMSDARQEFPIERQLRADMKEAMKAHDQLKVDTLRMALGAIRNLEVARTDRKNPEFGQPLTEADATHVLEQEVKRRNQAITLYRQGGRNDLVEKEQREMDILQAYLQASQISDEELRAIIAR